MNWLNKLENKRGSQPRCVLFMDGEREEVAARLTELVDLPDVLVSPTDTWMPYGKSDPAEAELDKADGLLPHDIQQKLGKWWLAVRRGNVTTPVWDIASTCSIKGKKGLILVEAKAHENELPTQGKRLDKNASENSQENHEQIGRAITEANRGLQSNIGGDWVISRDSHYQLSNRFAWSWKLASLGVPVVFVYLGFLNAQDMACDSPIFKSEEDWKRVLKNYSKNTVDNTCWEKRWDFVAPFTPVIRSYNQPFDPKKPDPC